MGYSRNYTIFDREIFDPVWGMSWSEVLRKHKRLQKSIEELIEFCINDRQESVSHIVEHRTIRWTLRRSNPQSLMMSDVMYYLRQSLGGSVQFSTRYLGDAKCLLGAATTGFLSRKVSAAEFRAIAKFEDGDNTGCDLTRSERLSLPEYPDPSTRPIYPWQETPSRSCEFPEDWVNVRETRQFLRVVWNAWDEDRVLSHLAPQADRHISVEITAEQVRTFGEFETAKLFQRARRAINRFRRPAMFMDVY